MFGLSHTVVNEICSVFSRYPNIEEVLIFGSRAKGNFHSGSDIDLAVKGQHITSVQLLDISLQIDDLDLLYKVDLLIYDDKQGTPVGAHIDRVGKTFYKK